MLTVAFYLIIALVVGVAVFYLVAIVFGGAEELVAVSPDDRPVGLPEDRPLTSEELSRLQLPVSARGYRMADTDQLLDRLTVELAQREQELADLRSQVARRDGLLDGPDDATSAALEPYRGESWRTPS